MKQSKRIALLLVLSAVLGTIVLAQEAPPKEPFRTVHLVALASAAEAAVLQAALEDVNAVMAQAGHPDVRYRLYKVVGEQAGPYNYLWESSWPGGEAYDKVHKSQEFIAVWKKHPEVETLMKNEVYNRYVEVPTKR